MMSKKLVLTEAVVVILMVILMCNESKADLLSQLGDLAKFGSCGIKVKNSDNYNKCIEKVTDNWKAETDVKKQACCKPLSLLDCTLETARKECNDGEVKTLETSEQTILAADQNCILYRQSPSMCGTNALLPLISVIVISILAVIRIA